MKNFLRRSNYIRSKREWKKERQQQQKHHLKIGKKRMSAIMLYIVNGRNISYGYDTLTFDEYVTIMLVHFILQLHLLKCALLNCDDEHSSKIIEITGNEFIEAGN